MKNRNYNLMEEYIFECIDFSDYPKQPETKGGKIAYLLEVCRSEKTRNYYKTEKLMFIDWCYGLPACFNMDYMEYRVVELCDKFGLSVPKNELLFDFWYGQLYELISYLSKTN